MGQEHKGKGVTVQLGPVAGPIGRTPEVSNSLSLQLNMH